MMHSFSRSALLVCVSLSFTLALLRPLASQACVGSDALLLDATLFSSDETGRGMRRTQAQPSYAAWETRARELGFEFRWVRNISDHVDYPVGKHEQIEGFCDDDAGIIYLNLRAASLSTIIHEMRHALHFGRRHEPRGSPFDVAVTLAYREFLALREQMAALRGLPPEEASEKIPVLAGLEKMIAGASEVAARFDESQIFARIGNAELFDESVHYRRLYRRQFAYHWEHWVTELPAGEFPELRALRVRFQEYYDATARALSAMRTSF